MKKSNSPSGKEKLAIAEAALYLGLQKMSIEPDVIASFIRGIHSRHQKLIADLGIEGRRYGIKRLDRLNVVHTLSIVGISLGSHSIAETDGIAWSKALAKTDEIASLIQTAFIQVVALESPVDNYHIQIFKGGLKMMRDELEVERMRLYLDDETRLYIGDRANMLKQVARLIKVLEAAYSGNASRTTQ